MIQTIKQGVLLSGAVLSMLMIVLWKLIPISTAEDRLKRIPLSGMRFHGIDVEVSPEEKQHLGEASILKRIYRFDGRKYWLTVVDGSKNRKAVHDPSYCYHGDGQQVDTDSKVDLGDGSGRVIRVQRNRGGFEQLTWFSDGETQYDGFLKYRLATAMRKLTFGKSGAEPVFVMVRTNAAPGEIVDWSGPAQEWFPQLGL